MGFSSGKSAAKRAAKKAEAAYYNEYFQSAKQRGKVEAIESIDVDGIKTVPTRYNEAVSKYNKRLDDLDRQMRGEALTERIDAEKSTLRSKTIADIQAKDAKNKNRNSILGGFGNGGYQGPTGMADYASNLSGGKKVDKNSAEYRADQKLSGRVDGSMGMAGIASMGGTLGGDTYASIESKYGRVGGYRENVANKAAYDELNTYAEEVNAAREADKVDSRMGDLTNQKGSAQAVTLDKQKRKARNNQGLRSTILAGGQAGADQAARKTVLG
jgi:hypothetical protein